MDRILDDAPPPVKIPVRRPADIYVKLHVRANLDAERIEDEDYVKQVAADAIYAGDVLDDELWSVDFAD